MEVGKTIKVKNKVGIMEVLIEEELDLTKINKTCDNLGKFEKLRVETYKEDWFSLCDGNSEIIYFFNLGYEHKGYKCKIVKSEEKEWDLENMEV